MKNSRSSYIPMIVITVGFVVLLLAVAFGQPEQLDVLARVLFEPHIELSLVSLFGVWAFFEGVRWVWRRVRFEVENHRVVTTSYAHGLVRGQLVVTQLGKDAEPKVYVVSHIRSDTQFAVRPTRRKDHNDRDVDCQHWWGDRGGYDLRTQRCLVCNPVVSHAQTSDTT